MGVGGRIRAPERPYLSGCCLEAQGRRDGRKGRCSSKNQRESNQSYSGLCSNRSSRRQGGRLPVEITTTPQKVYTKIYPKGLLVVVFWGVCVMHGVGVHMGRKARGELSFCPALLPLLCFLETGSLSEPEGTSSLLLGVFSFPLG